MQWAVAGIMPDTDRWVRDQMVVGYRSTLDLYGRRGMTLFAETPYFTLVKEGGGASLLHPCTRSLFPIP